MGMIDGEGVSLTSNAQKCEELNQSKISGARRVGAPKKGTIQPATAGSHGSKPRGSQFVDWKLNLISVIPASVGIQAVSEV
jgi:hypothetical protein